jgi:hypothetical protein
MNKKIVLVLAFFVFSVLLIYFMHWDNSVPLQEYFNNIENRLPEIEKISFRYYGKLNNLYYFTQDTIHANIKYNIFNKVEIYDRTKQYRHYSLDELPESFYKDFLKVKKICDELDVSDIYKDSLNRRINFSFRLKFIKSETIPNWNKKFENKKYSFNGTITYDVNNEKEKDSLYYKLKDKWYFYYGRLREDD